MQEHYDIIIVGAGIAGSAAATTFARQGYQVLLIERNLKEPDRTVGELLQPGGVIALEKLGLAAAIAGIDAIPVRGYHLYWKDEEVTFSYPALIHDHASSGDLCHDTKHGPRLEGRSFHHGRFVTRLRELAKNEAKATVVESTVTSLVTDEQTDRVIGYYSSLVIVADGASSNLRSQLQQRKPVAKSRFWRLELIDVELPCYGLACGVIGNGPPIVIYQIGAHETRILIDIPNAVHDTIFSSGSIRAYIKETVVPTLPKAVQSKVISALRSGRLRSMPNDWLPAQAIKTPGVLMIGDAGNIRHPLTGSGMTVALQDVILLRDIVDPAGVTFDDTGVVHKKLKSFHRKRKTHSTSLNILAQALYTLFVTNNPQLEVMQRGLVKYIKLGGKYAEEPCGLMGGVYRSPLLLFRHFFAIAIWSMWLLIRESSTCMMPVTLLRCAQVFYAAVRLILPFWSEL